MWVLRWISDESTLDIHLLLWRGFYLIDPFVNRAPFFFYWLPSQCFHYYDLVHVLFSFLTSSIVLTSHYPNQHSSTCLLSRSSSGHQSRLAAKWQPHLRTSLYLTPMLDPISRHYIVLFLYLLTCLSMALCMWCTQYYLTFLRQGLCCPGWSWISWAQGTMPPQSPGHLWSQTPTIGLRGFVFPWS
jgi:hypothetical protein